MAVFFLLLFASSSLLYLVTPRLGEAAARDRNWNLPFARVVVTMGICGVLLPVCLMLPVFLTVPLPRGATHVLEAFLIGLPATTVLECIRVKTAHLSAAAQRRALVVVFMVRASRPSCSPRAGSTTDGKACVPPHQLSPSFQCSGGAGADLAVGRPAAVLAPRASGPARTNSLRCVHDASDGGLSRGDAATGSHRATASLLRALGVVRNRTTVSFKTHFAFLHARLAEGLILLLDPS